MYSQRRRLSSLFSYKGAILLFSFLLTVRHLLTYFLILLRREPRFLFTKVFPLERSPVLVEGNGLEESGMKRSGYRILLLFS